MGERGPAPKRTEERLGHSHGTNPDQVKVAEVEAVLDPDARRALPLEQKIRQPVLIPEAPEHWLPVVKNLYESAQFSAQCIYWEPSDWHLLLVTCESLHRDLDERIVYVPKPGSDGTVDDIVREEVPIKGASLVAYTKIMTLLGFTEDARRRMGIEVHRKQLNLEGKADLHAVAPIGAATDRRATRLQ